MKPTKVELINKTGEKRSFIIEHASHLLSISKYWDLPEDSKFKYEKGDLVRRKSTSKDSGGQTSQERSAEGDTSE